MKHFIALVVASLLTGSVVFAADPTTGDAKTGRETYLKSGCDQCHGREAQGSPTSGPKLGPEPLPFPAFTVFIRTPRLQMPPYRVQILSDKDVADIYAYVSSQPAPAAIDKLPQ